MSEPKREYTKYQQGVIRRYYDNRETISIQRLGEMVSDLYLATSEKKKNSLWKQVEKALLTTEVNEVWLKKVVADQNLDGLAKIVNSLG